LLVAAQSNSAAETVQSLRYGVSLYHFYQQDYFNALSELMIGQQQHELGEHANNAELLRGGMSLSYGMDIQAQRIFTGFLALDVPAEDRDRAWFYLAKMARQRGQWERSAAAMENIAELASPALNEELNYMRTELSVRQGDFVKAGEYLALLPPDSEWLPYHYYNMGALHAAAGDWSAAARYFRQFERLDLRTDEAKSLRDRAYTASGFAFLAAGDHAQASHDFTRVRLNSPLAERALLGYGWAASKQHDYLAALSPWQSLGEKPPRSRSVRESLLAIPYAYEQLGREGAALASYQGAAGVFYTELERINTAIAAFTDGDIQKLLDLRPQGAEDWLFGPDILPVNPQTPYLSQTISSHAFQNAMKELRDLHQLDRRLQLGQQRLQVLADANTEQQDNWTRLIEQDRQQQLRQRLADLLTQAAALQRKFTSAEQEADGRALADADRLALWQRLEHAVALADELNADPGQKHRIALLRGLLIWQDNEQFPELLWLNRQQLRELHASIGQAATSLQRLQETIDGRRLASFAPRISALQESLSAQHSRVQVALIASGSEVRRVAIAELQQQARELARSLALSKLAVARLYDKSSTGAQL
jgi:hypothetical protein